MKKVFLVALMAFSLVATAQINFGVKGGVNLSDLNSSSSLIKLDSKASYHVGVMAEILLGGKFGIQPEILYSAQGAEFKSKIQGVEAGGKLKLDYISVPVMAKIYIIPGLSVEAGPQFSFNTSSKTELGALGLKKDFDVKKIIKKYDVSLCFGAGYKFSKFSVNARYNLGVSDIYKDGGSDSDIDINKIFSTDKLRNGVLQVSVGFYF